MMARRDAPALRFLLLCIGGWIALRIMMVWNPALSLSPDAVPARWTPPSPFAASSRSPDNALPAAAVPVMATGEDLRTPAIWASSSPDPMEAPAAIGPVPAGLLGDRHSLRLALIARLLPSLPGDGAARSAAGVGGQSWLPAVPSAGTAPGQGKPFWIRQSYSSWSLATWVYLREGSGAAPEAVAGTSQLGGSQAGLRLAHGFGDSGRLSAYGRATIALQRTQQREVALGLAFAPLARLPIDIAFEQRVAVGKEGRTALAIMATGGVSDVTLPAGFRLDAYAQAGVVGARRRDGFADGAIVVDRRLGGGETSLSLGALAAGAVQPGAARVDVGPRLTLRLPKVGEGGRIALDWRQRVAGDARPESGLALTLAADF